MQQRARRSTQPLGVMSTVVDKSPQIETVEGRLRYGGDHVPWEIVIANIAVIGEYTNQNGPYAVDYFLVFMERGHTQWYEASFYAHGRDEALKSLAIQLGAELECQLSHSTDFRSRVMWPSALAGREMFQWTSRSFGHRVTQRIHPQIAEFMTPNTSLERTREG